MNKAEIRAVVDKAPWPNSPFKLGGRWCSISKDTTRMTRKPFYSVRYGGLDVAFPATKRDLINYLHEAVNNYEYLPFN